MSDTRMKNAYFLCSLISFTLIIFSNCTSQTNQNGTEYCQSLKKNFHWKCQSSDSCWYYTKYKNENHLDDYTPIQPCGSSEDSICCPERIYGDSFCQQVKNLSGWKCENKKSCSHYDATNYQTTSSHVGRDIKCTSNPRKICCPPPPPTNTTTTTTTERTPHFSLSIGEASKIVEAKCEEYEKSYLVQQSNCSSGSTYSDYKTETEEKEFPHMAAIGYEIENEIEWLCGGSLISERFVLSAAHCAYYMRTKAKLVLLGATRLQAIGQNSNAVNYTIIDWIFHPRYDAESNFLKHDIVLFKLDDDVKFSAFVRPICLATFSSSPPKTAVITGYGKYRTGMMNPSGKLLKGNVKIEQNKEACLDDFKDSKLYKNPINASTIICTQNEKRITQDGCYGDSGGPMQTQKNKNICFYELHGIVSSGPYICGDSSRPYSIYTNVSSYIDWIQQEVWPDN